MKLIKLSFLVIVGIASITSCTKLENEKSSNSEVLSFVKIEERQLGLQTARPGITLVEWEQWGRKKKNCGGMGLCDADWFPEAGRPTPINGGSSIIEQNSNDEFYFEILFSQTPPSNLEDFIIDEDIFLDTEIHLGVNLTIKAGTYLVNTDLGNYGGYRIMLYQ